MFGLDPAPEIVISCGRIAKKNRKIDTEIAAEFRRAVFIGLITD